MPGVEGKALAVAFAGGVLLFSGVKGKQVTGALKDIIGGKNPNTAGSTAITPGPTSIAGGESLPLLTGGNSSSLASDALQYEGHPYQYGGYYYDPSGWDCSSYMNWVIGHDAGMAIPQFSAGTYSGAVHGPTTLDWLVTNLATTIPQAQLQAGDLCVWQTHMGMCTGNGMMISALDPSLATRQTTITGGAPGAEVLVCRRL